MRFAATVAALAGLMLSAGCASRPGTAGRRVVLAAEMRGNALIVAIKGGKEGPYHFLVDTGSSRTLVSPAVAKALGTGDGRSGGEVEVRSAEGRSTLLPAATLTKLNLGGAKFENVPVLVYDTAALSEELGMPVDGVLGFSLFRDTLLTLDYPHTRVILGGAPDAGDLEAATLSTNPGTNIPVVTVHLGDRAIYAIVDSGKEIPLSLNRTVARQSDFSFGPVPGTLVHDLAGDRRQRIGRVGLPLHIGRYVVPRPVAELTEDLSTIGGGVLKFFAVTFDQAQGTVQFVRAAGEPIAIPGQRGAGLSFTRTPAYWRAAGIMPGSPAEKAGVAPGDLVTRIDGEPVSKWDRSRYDALLANADQVRLTFLAGTRELEKNLPIVDLVP